ncbi:protein of unknown function (plasmid) [Cupriavidus taiwanensis]|uniref:Uncharacterized protein n=1 Tax=Cupriavidus taiwanensis TaxID=164546 RepID=A0A375IPU7_9BURK|nr:hypothetical protein CBM2592_B80027 [Cupriavidus taiwanensis]SOY96780.1 hypothetical protein CBM2591_B60028 [Cupriavidus taiwanensis]SOZ66695.1 hypothetical protein CBM2617_B100027 [Cupriavidus taiwanensis]SOZ83936.1 hypothetical protein CBM2618_B100028 [Cupriavidus taiwanensis]SOZ86655.1 hypothetical protein CBM2622_B110027 [Cupriavidus taiwanensis]
MGFRRCSTRASAATGGSSAFFATPARFEARRSGTHASCVASRYGDRRYRASYILSVCIQNGEGDVSKSKARRNE